METVIVYLAAVLLPITIATDQQVVLNARGLIVSVLTPLNEDQTVNFEAIPPYAKYLADAGLKYIDIGEGVGEIFELSLQDAKDIVKAWTNSCNNNGLRAIVQVGATPYVEVIELAKYCATLDGIDALITYPDLFFKATNVTGLVDYLGSIAKAAPNLPMLYNHVPQRTNVDVSMSELVVAATAAIPTFRGLRYGAKNLEDAYVTKRKLIDGQEIFFVADSVLSAALVQGFTSATAAVINLFPKLAEQVVTAINNSDVVTARNANDKLSLVTETLNSLGGFVPVLKAAMEIVTGLNVGPPALPQRAVSNEVKEQLRQKLSDFGLINNCD